MKVIKDCEWEVYIEKTGGTKYLWYVSKANDDEHCAIQRLLSEFDYKTKQSAKRNWERFAKLNKIKKWKYV